MAGQLKAGHRLEFEHARDGRPERRTGRVWSAGPVPATYWVQPDDDPAHPVAVKVPPATLTNIGKLPYVVQASATAAQQEDAMARVRRVAKAGQVFGAADPEQLTLTGERAVTYHVSEQCPALAGMTRTVRYGRPDVLPSYRVTDLLLGKRGRVPLQLCRTCIYEETS
jgi:hypothetical protein